MIQATELFYVQSHLGWLSGTLFVGGKGAVSVAKRGHFRRRFHRSSDSIVIIEP